MRGHVRPVAHAHPLRTRKRGKTAVSDADSSRHQASRVVAAEWVWAPPSARTPLVANLVSTGCSPDSALPSTSGADSEELPILQGTQLKAKRATLALPPPSPPSRSLSGGEVACLFEADPLPRSPPAYVDALGNLRVTLTKPFTGEPSIGASATNGDRTRARRARSGILQLKAKRATLALPPSPPPSRSLSGGEVACLFEADPLPRSPPAYVDALGNLRVTLTKPFTGEPSIGASATNGDRTRARRARSEFQLTLHFTRRLALRAKGARVRDSTVYGGSSTSAKSSFEHHTQQLAAAVQVDDAMGTWKKITDMKMRLIQAALKATGRG